MCYSQLFILVLKSIKYYIDLFQLDAFSISGDGLASVQSDAQEQTGQLAFSFVRKALFAVNGLKSEYKSTFVVFVANKSGDIHHYRLFLTAHSARSRPDEDGGTQKSHCDMENKE